ncbi:HIT family protein [Polynucleobacter paneuropaeus]|jgi:diadenosine tetraphosphate (Ap4A) HIT family hydrolase|nr:HIT family protein [Polynucleobacter paneuropaeus]
MTCLFCEIPQERIIASNDLAYGIRDGFPVTALHTLVIPKRHAVDCFDLTNDELLSCYELVHKLKESIIKEDKTVVAFNIGMNAGEAAGQTIFHSHIHLIPRRRGDVANPRGGVRHVIPEKGHYQEVNDK